MRHTIPCATGKKIEVKVCKHAPGSVLLQVIDVLGRVESSVAMSPDICGFLISALEEEGAAAEVWVQYAVGGANV